MTADDFQDQIMNIVFALSAAVGTMECATFSITDDNQMEALEFFTVQATPTTGAFVAGQDTAQVTIMDNDGKDTVH